MSVKIVILLCVASAVAAGSLVYKYARQVETKKVVKDNVVTVVREVIKPDGTVIRDSKTVDKSVKTIEAAPLAAIKPDWLVKVGYGIDKNYSFGVAKRVMGNVYVGAEASQSGVLSATVTITF